MDGAERPVTARSDAPPTLLERTDGILAGLNPEQRQAVEHFEGPCLVLAGPGSGKTRVLTTRVCRLILDHGVPPERIIAVTFTNKAAAEMRERVTRMLGGAPKGIWMGTFHKIGARLLRRHAPAAGLTPAFTIRNAEQSLREIKRAAAGVGVNHKRHAPKNLRWLISTAKNMLLTPAQYAESTAGEADPHVGAAARVYPAYERALRAQDATDFDDLLVLPVRLLEKDEALRNRYGEHFAFVLVDEFQDTNAVQFKFLSLLASRHRNLMVVGDDDQAIYGWRGADIRNILDFEAEFQGAGVVKLERNYRSTQAILDIGNAVIDCNETRKAKTMRTQRRGGAPVALAGAEDELDEARWIVEEIERLMLSEPARGHGDFAVLYRTNAQSRALEDRLRRRGVPYQIVGGLRFYERREIQDVLAYLNLVANPRDDNAFERVVNYPRRGLGQVSVNRLSSFATERAMSLLEAAESAREAPGLAAAAVRGARGFAKLIRDYAALSENIGVGDLLKRMVEELGLISLLRNEAPEESDRIDNLKEFIAAAELFDEGVTDELEGGGMEDMDEDASRDPTPLQLFLQQMALVTDVDNHDAGADAVVLMTLHTAKGLEFPIVFVSGLEEGLLPLGAGEEGSEHVEEERRLCYVGVTRAQDRLYLTYARRRRRFGEYSSRELSSFADPILDKVEWAATRPASWAAPGRRGRWRRDGGPAANDGMADRPSGRLGAGEWDDEGFDQDRPQFAKGEAVVHQTFGSGTIVELSGFGADLKVVVDFGDAGRKKLLVRYAGLQKDYV